MPDSHHYHHQRPPHSPPPSSGSAYTPLTMHRTQPSTTKTVLVTLLTVFLVLLIISLTIEDRPSFITRLTSSPRTPTLTPTSTTTSASPSGTISPLLHAQNLSHFSFHNPTTKLYLLSLVTTEPDQSVIIIGLAQGGEAVRMARTHSVHAFEPMPHYVDNFLKRKKPTIANVTVYPVAATSKSGNIEVMYNGIRKNVPARRPDHLLPHDVTAAVVSVDVQGKELDALRGLGKVLDRTASVWVEVICQSADDPPLEILEFLNERFVLFDFVPWGKRPGVENNQAREQFLEGPRPDGIKDWAKWFCERRHEFQWLQTDILGVKRELLEQNPDVMEGLNRLGERNCQEGCAYRKSLE